MRRCDVPRLPSRRARRLPLARLGEVFRATPRELLLQVVEGASPVRAIFASSVDLAAQDQAAAQLIEAGYHMDLVEPLERVTAALQTLVQPA